MLNPLEIVASAVAPLPVLANVPIALGAKTIGGGAVFGVGGNGGDDRYIPTNDKGEYKYGDATDLQKQYMVEIFGPDVGEQERARLYNEAVAQVAARAQGWKDANVAKRPQVIGGSLEGEGNFAWEPKASYTARTGFSGEDYDKYVRQSLKADGRWIGSQSQRDYRQARGMDRFSGEFAPDSIFEQGSGFFPDVKALEDIQTQTYGGGRGSQSYDASGAMEYGPSIASMARSARKDRIRRGRLLPAADVETPVGEYGPSIASMATAARMYGPSQ